MITVLAVAAAVVWLLVAIAVGVAIGMGISEADRREGTTDRPEDKPCCPHPVSEAPETVRGQFRAIVVVPAEPGPADPRGTHVDVRA